ncbi:MAG: gamma-glutamylcyclotransferase [Planctomyces sp.]|nr:gamma-glutamylcyclotransferase [Planctomyces sp.]
MKSVIFVYGSLKRGYALHGLLEKQLFMGEAESVACGRLFDLGDYPGLVASESGYRVRGELYAVTAECLAALDGVEGVEDGVYERRRIELVSPNESISAEAYFYRLSVNGCREIGSEWHPER